MSNPPRKNGYPDEHNYCGSSPKRSDFPMDSNSRTPPRERPSTHKPESSSNAQSRNENPCSRVHVPGHPFYCGCSICRYIQNR